MSLKVLKKGFTIVELVIVIAVIAILAGVLIPTFANLVDKANETVDMQLVKQMNTILEAEEIVDGEPSTVFDAQDILKKNGIIQFKPVDSNNVFYWVGSKNKVLLWKMNKDDQNKGEVIYPENLKKEYKDYDEVSKDWKDLNVEKSNENYIVIEPDENGEITKQTLLNTIESAHNGSTIKLGLKQTINFGNTFYQLGEKLGKNKSLIIDLNDSSIICNSELSTIILENSSLEFINGFINYTGLDSDKAALIPDENAHLILKNVEMKVEGSAIFPRGTASEVIIDNCNIISDGHYGVGTNALYSNNIRISITNSNITCSGCSVFINVKSNVIIDNCNILSKGGYGIVIRVGNFSINDSTVKVELENIDIVGSDFGLHGKYSAVYYEFGYNQNQKAIPSWGGAYQQPYAVISAGLYFNGDSYIGDVKVNMQNVKLESSNKSYCPEIILAAYHKIQEKNVEVIYDDKCLIDKDSIKIYGDSLSHSSTGKTYLDVNNTQTITVNGKKVTLDSNGKTHIEE